MTEYIYSFLTERNKERTIKDTSIDFLAKKELTVLSLDHAVVVSRKAGGPGVFSSDGYVKESDLHIGFSSVRGIPNESLVHYNDEEVVYVGCLLSVWGHCLTDNLKHLWFLQDERYVHLKKLKFVYTMLNDDDSLSSGMLALYNKLGIHEDQLIRVTGVERFLRIYLPEQCFFCVPGGDFYKSGYRYYTKEYKRIVQAILDNTKMTSGPEKVYFTRTKWVRKANQKYRDFGENYIEDFFRELGYEIISPEEFSLDEQISIVHGCKRFATTQGSTSLNALFCEDGTEVCIINKQNYNAPYQLAINHLIPCRITIIDANKSTLNSKKTPWAGPFFMYRSKELCAWGGKPYKGFPIKDYALYLFIVKAREMKRKLSKPKNKIRNLVKACLRAPFSS